MTFAARLRSWLSALLRGRQVEREMDEEWQFHLDAHVADLMATGLSRREAERVARLEFGDPLRWKEQGREARGLRLINDLRGDVQYALRQMRRTPTFTLVVTATFAIAIGANTAMFSLVDAVLMKRLPVPHPDELKQLAWVAYRHGFSARYNGSARLNAAGERVATSFAYTVFTDIRDRSTTFSDVFCFSDVARLSVTLPGGAQLVEGQFVSGTFFRGLGVNAILGRTITADDDRAGAAPVAIISHRLWQRAFGGATDVVGQRFSVNGAPVVVAGVSPPSFFGIRRGSRPDVMLPLSLQSILDASMPPEAFTRADHWSFEVMARVKPGVEDARAQAETETLVRQSILASPPTAPYDLPRLVLQPGSQGLGDLRREYANPLRILMAVAGAILLIACANIAGLLIARASAREREIGTRLALGAGRARIVRQLVTESVVLATLGGALGFALAYALRHLLPILVTEGAATVDLDLAIDARMIAFTAGTCLATGIACGLLPALRATGVDVAALVGRSLSGSWTRASRLWSGKVLIAVQVALSVVLLVGAGLFVRTLFNLRSEALGFQPEGLLLFRINPTQSGYRDQRLNDFYEQAITRIAAVPGVRSVSISRYAILAGGATTDGISVAGSTSPPIGTHIHYIAPRYFETMGIPMLLGRDVGWQDREGSQRVTVVNEALARRLFGDASPLGQRLMHPKGEPGDVMEVVGVVADAKFADLRRAAPTTIYVPYRIRPQRLMTFAVRTAAGSPTRQPRWGALGDPEAMVGSIRAAVGAVDPNVALYDVWTQEVQIDQAIRQERIFANLVSGFALVALLLACLGIYGTLSYAVARRTPEIGVRMALGARRADVVGLMLRESAGPVLIGAAAGIAGAAATARVIQSMLFGITPYDTLTVVGALLVLAASALLAAWIPSARASRVEPMMALRYD